MNQFEYMFVDLNGEEQFVLNITDTPSANLWADMLTDDGYQVFVTWAQ